MSTTTSALVVVACLLLQAAESKVELSLTSESSKPVERAARSIQPRIRQSSALGSCTQQQVVNIYSDYPSDCAHVLQSVPSATLTDARVVASIYSTLCKPRCNQALARFYFECSFEALGEVFIQLCSTNANNQRCYNLLGTLDTDATSVQSSCPMNGSCPSSCRSSILTYRNNAGCCVNIFNTSVSPFMAADNYRFWASCSVETPGFCTQSTVSRSTSGTKCLCVFSNFGIETLILTRSVILFILRYYSPTTGVCNYVGYLIPYQECLPVVHYEGLYVRW